MIPVAGTPTGEEGKERRVTLESAVHLLGYNANALRFSPWFDHHTQTVPEWLVFTRKGRAS